MVECMPQCAKYFLFFMAGGIFACATAAIALAWLIWKTFTGKFNE